MGVVCEFQLNRSISSRAICKNVFLCVLRTNSGQTDRQTEKKVFLKILKTPLGPTRMLFVNFSSIGSLVFEQFVKTAFWMCFCGQPGRQTQKFGSVLSGVLFPDEFILNFLQGYHFRLSKQ